VNRKTGIAAAVLLALCAVSAPLWAQEREWPSWLGRDNADKKAWDEMGACYAGLMELNQNGRARELADQLYANASQVKAKQNLGVRYWKKNKTMYQASLAELQQQKTSERLAEEQRRAEERAAKQKAEEERRAAEQKAEEERLAAIAAVNARGVTEADFTVDITRDGRGVIITGYKGAATVVKIPATYQKMPVREISRENRGAFYNNKTITSVVIPQGVTAVSGFEGCTQLAQVTLPSTLRSIGVAAFEGTALKTVVIPRGVTEIGSSAFADCTSLASVTIPNSVTVIGQKAFKGCTSLTSITIPNGVTLIDDEAFMDCTSLTTVTIAPIKRDFGWFRGTFYGCKLNIASQAALRAAGYSGDF
jgi:hypothetical protein